jgi:NhaP-type Na+/H+ or K+/H+ antiporter
LLDITLESPILRVVATLSLVLVLFTDALTIDLRELRQYRTLALIVLGPGTVLSAVLVSAAGWWLLGLAPAAAVILGASLSSTDPVLLRGLLRRRDVPPSARQALRLESGLNDVVLLPLVLVAAALLNPEAGRSANDWARMFIDLFLLGPGAGIVVGVLAVATLDLVRRRIGIRRDYESLFALGVAFSAYAAAEALHGSGFLAAFAAGLTISALDIELCDCFLEYGETTAELALLFTFVLFGSSLIWSGFSVLSWGVIIFAVLALLIRPVAFLLSLAPLHIDRRSRLLIAWFGPRGLSSLLLVLLAVFQGLPGSEYLFQVCCVVVLLSVLLHGFSPFVLDRKQALRGRRQETGDGRHEEGMEEEPASHVAPIVLVPVVPEMLVADKERISLDEFHTLRATGKQVYLVDVRTTRSLARSDEQAIGAIRMPPDHVVERATELRLPKDAWIVLYCT